MQRRSTDRGPHGKGRVKIKPPARRPRQGKGAAKVRRPTSSAVSVTPAPEAELPTDGKIRINRYLALSGVCSRRAADTLVKGGNVAINGVVVRELGTRIDPVHDTIECNGEKVEPERPTYVLFNKPKAVVCTNAANEQRRRVIDFLPPQCGRLFTVGRLDADSEGLVIATNDGQFAQRIAHPSFGIAKTYSVVLRGRIDTEALDKARGGVWLAEGRTAESKMIVERRTRDKSYLKVSLREGRNREIRRIFAKVGFSVLALKRIRIGPLNLHGLGRGRYRFLTREETQRLLELAQG